MIITKIKLFFQKILPRCFYGYIYKLYKILIGDYDSDRDSRYALFTQRCVHVCKVDDIQFKIIIDPKNGGVDYEIFSKGVYEQGVLNVIKNHVKKNDVFYDIGANIGQHSLFTSFFVDTVYSFEPVPSLYDQFLKSVHHNNIYNIKIENIGIGNSHRKEYIYLSQANMGGSSILNKDSSLKKELIEIKTLDAYIQENNTKPPTFIKIDVEGLEYEVLQGARDTISRYSPIILLEFSPILYEKFDKDMGKQIISFLFEEKYDIYDIGDGSKKVKIKNFSQVIDAKQTNILCIK